MQYLDYYQRMKVLVPSLKKEEVSIFTSRTSAVPTIIRWDNQATQPTHTEIMSVTDAQLKDELDDMAVDLSRVPNYFKAYVELMLDEMNTLRQAHGLQPRTLLQLKAAMKEKL